MENVYVITTIIVVGICFMIGFSVWHIVLHVYEPDRYALPCIIFYCIAIIAEIALLVIVSVKGVLL